MRHYVCGGVCPGEICRPRQQRRLKARLAGMGRLVMKNLTAAESFGKCSTSTSSRVRWQYKARDFERWLSPEPMHIVRPSQRKDAGAKPGETFRSGCYADTQRHDYATVRLVRSRGPAAGQ